MFQTKNKIEEATISAVIIRADGTKEDLGVIALYRANLIKKLIGKIKRRLK